MPLADGVEEMEAVIIIDVLRRARWEVVSAGIHGDVVNASRGVKLLPDTEWRNIDPASFDVLILPGGSEGTNALCSDETVLETIRSFVREKKPVAAICAGPLVLESAGILKERRATCHPAVRDRLISARVQDDRVVIDGRIITSQGPGTAFEFALAIIRLVDGNDAADAVAEGLVL